MSKLRQSKTSLKADTGYLYINNVARRRLWTSTFWPFVAKHTTAAAAAAANAAAVIGAIGAIGVPVYIDI